MAAALLVCLITYVAGLVAGRRDAGQVVQGRQWRHAEAFVAAAVVTWLPFVVVTFWPKPNEQFISEQDKVAFYVASIFLSSNGLFNAIVYAWLSGFVRRTRRWTVMARAQSALDAQNETSGDLSPRSTGQPSTQSASTSDPSLTRTNSALKERPSSFHRNGHEKSSFSVAFNVGGRDEVVSVPSITAIANRRAELATAQLEAEKRPRPYSIGTSDFLMEFANRQAELATARLEAEERPSPNSSGVSNFLGCFDEDEQSPRSRPREEEPEVCFSSVGSDAGELAALKGVALVRDAADGHPA